MKILLTASLLCILFNTSAQKNSIFSEFLNCNYSFSSIKPLKNDEGIINSFALKNKQYINKDIVLDKKSIVIGSVLQSLINASSYKGYVSSKNGLLHLNKYHYYDEFDLIREKYQNR